MADLHHPRPEGRRRTAELLRRFDLVEAARKPVATFSGGMRRKPTASRSWTAAGWSNLKHTLRHPAMTESAPAP
jgi:ABC-type Na+ transport system ATPase subunit NatA